MKISVKRLMPGIIVLLLIIGLVLVVMDWTRITEALAQASLQPIPFALAATAVSYFCISLSFAWVSKLLGLGMRSQDLVAVGFVSTVLNHIVSSGGTAGYSVRYALMNRHDVDFREVLTVSILHFYLTSLVMIGMLPVGLMYLLLHTSLSQQAAILLAALALIVMLAAAATTGLVLGGSMRTRLMRLAERAGRRLLRRELGPMLERFDATMTQGVQAFRRQPLMLVGIMLLIIVDWSASAAALWFSYRALGIGLGVGELIAGFVIGTMAGVASMIPGGLGVQEGSMAGVLALLGVPFDRAVLASMVFRLVYLILPYLISLGFYAHLLRRWDGARRMPAMEGQHAHPDG